MRCVRLYRHPPSVICCFTADGPVYVGIRWAFNVSQEGRVPSEEGGAWQERSSNIAKSVGSTLRCRDADRGIAGKGEPWSLLIEREL